MTYLKAGKLTFRTIQVTYRSRKRSGTLEFEKYVHTENNELIKSAGLFENEDIPNPTMENWQRNMKPWETPAKGTKYQSQVS